MFVIYDDKSGKYLSVSTKYVLLNKNGNYYLEYDFAENIAASLFFDSRDKAQKICNYWKGLKVLPLEGVFLSEAGSDGSVGFISENRFIYKSFSQACYLKPKKIGAVLTEKSSSKAFVISTRIVEEINDLI